MHEEGHRGTAHRTQTADAQIVNWITGCYFKPLSFGFVWDATKANEHTRKPLQTSPTSTPQKFRQGFFGGVCARQEQCWRQRGSGWV